MSPEEWCGGSGPRRIVIPGCPQTKLHTNFEVTPNATGWSPKRDETAEIGHRNVTKSPKHHRNVTKLVFVPNMSGTPGDDALLWLASVTCGGNQPHLSA